MSNDLDTQTTDYSPPPETPENGNGRHAAPTEMRDPRLAPTRRRWPWLLAGLALGGAAVFVVTTWIGNNDDTQPVVSETIELTTVQVSNQDLVEEVDWSGTLSSGVTIDVAAPTDGVVTAASPSGSTIARGDVIVEIDAEPVVALFGEIPMWRNLGEGAEGDDVRQLEANLVHLGYDPDGDVTVDDQYTSATEDMVERWEEAHGLDPTGEVTIERVTVLPGPTEVVVAPAVGSFAKSGTTLMTVAALAARIDVVGWESGADTQGEIDTVASVGTPIEHGTVLYEADGVDVVTVVNVSAETEAVLAAMGSGDVEQLESVLVYVGFDPDRSVQIDDEVDPYTNAAVTRWQESVGLPPTGSTDPSHYVVVTEAAEVPYAVGEVYLEPGDLLGNGAVVMAIEAPSLTVTADVAIGEIDEFTIGDTVIIEQLDESTFTGVVTSIAEVANPAEGQGAVPTITVTFDVVTEPDDYVSGAVTITTESSRIDDAMVVPSRALITLSEGGYAVEKQLADGTASLVGVEIGTFDDGMVEIVSVTVGELAVGDDVVVPA